MVSTHKGYVSWIPNASWKIQQQELAIDADDSWKNSNWELK
jgi:hypothetical protein